MSKRSSLSGRLNRLKKDGLAPPVKKVVEKKESLRTPLPGWVDTSPHMWRRSVIYENPLPQNFSSSLLVPQSISPYDLVFYDTETTGLSTGAGTIPFLIGFGRLCEKGFEVIQFFLSDYPGEKAMLEALLKEFGKNKVFLSYNGKSYDSHLINTRFLMNGIPYDSRLEVDLLYTCRRFWKKILKDCRLGTIEEEILKIKRGPDIPGAEIPDVWFNYLKDGKTDQLELVFSHNLQDIHTLAVLLSQLEKIINELDQAVHYDRGALGRFLLLHKDSRGEDVLHQEFLRGDRDSGIFLSLYLKREERWEEAESIWKRLNNKGCHLFSVEELAKYYEHKVKMPEKALRIVDAMIKGPIPLSQEIKDRLNHRKKRLISKMEKS